MAKKGKFVFVKTNGKTVKLHSTDQFVRERVMNPEECQKGTFRTKKSGEHEIIVCKPKGKKKTEVQAILHPEPLPKVEKEVKGRYAQELTPSQKAKIREEDEEFTRKEVKKAEKQIKQLAKELSDEDLKVIGKIKKDMTPEEKAIFDSEYVARMDEIVEMPEELTLPYEKERLEKFDKERALELEKEMGFRQHLPDKYEKRIEKAQKEMGELRKKAKKLETEELIVLAEDDKATPEEMSVYSKEIENRSGE